MSFLDAYKQLISKQGENIAGNVIESSKINLTNEFKNFPTYKIGRINDVQVDLRELKQKNPNPYTSFRNDQRTFLFLPDEKVYVGDIVELEGNKYILYDSNEDEIFPSFHAIKTNNTLDIETIGEKVIVDYDPLGRPIYDEGASEITSIPCFITTYSKFSEYTEFDEKINLPEGRMYVLLPTNNEDIQEGFVFTMYNESFKVNNLDLTRVRDGRGVVELVVTKLQK